MKIADFIRILEPFADERNLRQVVMHSRKLWDELAAGEMLPSYSQPITPHHAGWMLYIIAALNGNTTEHKVRDVLGNANRIRDIYSEEPVAADYIGWLLEDQDRMAMVNRMIINHADLSLRVVMNDGRMIEFRDETRPRAMEAGRYSVDVLEGRFLSELQSTIMTS